jgi:hypothetical protein
MSSVVTYSDPASDRNYSVVVSAAAMPAKCWGRYAHVGVVSTTANYVPCSLSSRPKGVLGFPFYQERLFDGRTDRCARGKAEEQAHGVAQARLEARVVFCNSVRSAGYLESLAERVDEI